MISTEYLIETLILHYYYHHFHYYYDAEYHHSGLLNRCNRTLATANDSEVCHLKHLLILDIENQLDCAYQSLQYSLFHRLYRLIE